MPKYQNTGYKYNDLYYYEDEMDMGYWEKPAEQRIKDFIYASEVLIKEIGGPTHIDEFIDAALGESRSLKELNLDEAARVYNHIYKCRLIFKANGALHGKWYFKDHLKETFYEELTNLEEQVEKNSIEENYDFEADEYG